MSLMQAAIVDELAEFLELPKYEVLYLRQRLAGEHSLAPVEKQAHYTTLEVTTQESNDPLERRLNYM